MEVSRQQFEALVAQAIDALPAKYLKNLKNVAFVVEDEPNDNQRQKLQLQGDATLFGLYEGIPLTKRGINYSLVLPDKITLFQLPLQGSSQTLQELQERIYHTVWHEVAHYFGLDHTDIAKRDQPF